MYEEAIEIRNLYKSFGRTVVLAGIDLTVKAGTICALLGPNGAGKTTLISILSTLSAPDTGTAVVLGHDVVLDPNAVRRSISLTGQYAAVDEVLTGTENLRMMARLSGFGARESRIRADELLAQFGLEDAADKRVSSYSGGMRRRLDIAIGLVSSPPVLFLDEPTTGLDTRSRQELWAVITALAAAGTTVLLTTQYLEEADKLADHIAVIDHGRVVAEGTAAELKSLIGGEVVELLDESGTVVLEVPTDGSIASHQAAMHEIAASLRQTGFGEGEGELRVGVRRPSLDEVFLAITDPTRGSAPLASSDDTHHIPERISA